MQGDFSFGVVSGKSSRGLGAGFLGLVEGERKAKRNDEEGATIIAMMGGNKKPNKAVTDQGPNRRPRSKEIQSPSQRRSKKPGRLQPVSGGVKDTKAECHMAMN